jgi:hypothetical protein
VPGSRNTKSPERSTWLRAHTGSVFNGNPGIKPGRAPGTHHAGLVADAEVFGGASVVRILVAERAVEACTGPDERAATELARLCAQDMAVTHAGLESLCT